MIKLLTTIILQFLLVFTVWSQKTNSLTDSLFDVLNETHPDKKATILNKIADSYLPGDPDKALNYARQAIQIAHRVKDTEQEGLSLKISGASYYNLFRFSEALDAYNTAIVLFAKNNDQKQRAAVFINIGLVYKDQNSYVDAQINFKNALQIYDSIGYPLGTANAYNYLGSLSLKQGFAPMALEYYFKSLQIRLEGKNPVEIAASYNNIALAYKELNQLNNSLENYNKALEFRNKSGNKTLIANTLNEIGSLYWKVGRHEKALEYYFRSIKIRYESGNKSEVADSYVNIGNLYNNLDSYEKSKEYYLLALNIYNEVKQQQKIANTLTLLGNIEIRQNQTEALNYYNNALSIRRDIGIKKDIAGSLNNIGSVYVELNQLSKALDYFKEALDIRNEIEDNYGIMTTLNNIGELFLKNNNKIVAVNYFTKVLELAKAKENDYYMSLCARKLAEVAIEDNVLKQAPRLLELALTAGKRTQNAELIKNAELAYYKYYEKIKEYELALKSFVVYTQISDSLSNLKKNQKMLSLEQSLELEKKNNELKAIENEVRLLRQDKDLQKLTISKQKHLRNGLLLISILTILITILLWNRNQIKKKTNNKLHQQYDIIKKTNEILIIRENELNKLSMLKDKYFSVIAHDIKNPLSALINLSRVIVDKIDTLKPKEIQDFSRMIYQSANNLNGLLENLLYWARSNSNNLQYDPEAVKISTIIRNVTTLNKLSALQKNLTIKNEINEQYEIYADIQMVTSIFRNLISNAIKFSRENGTITLTAENQGRMIAISVIDEGIGMSKEIVEKIFDLNKQFTSNGTHNETGTGLGLILVKEFVEKNQGEISVKSEKDKGSIFTFTLPNSTW
jgi:signal transduction histidine kinase